MWRRNAGNGRETQGHWWNILNFDHTRREKSSVSLILFSLCSSSSPTSASYSGAALLPLLPCAIKKKKKKVGKVTAAASWGAAKRIQKQLPSQSQCISGEGFHTCIREGGSEAVGEEQRSISRTSVPPPHCAGQQLRDDVMFNEQFTDLQQSSRTRANIQCLLPSLLSTTSATSRAHSVYKRDDYWPADRLGE